MNTNFGPYSIRNLRPKSAKVAANGYTATLLRNGHPVANLDCGNAPDNDDLDTLGSTAEARKHGKLRSEGKTYRVKDGDVLEILFSR